MCMLNNAYVYTHTYTQEYDTEQKEKERERRILSRVVVSVWKVEELGKSCLEAD